MACWGFGFKGFYLKTTKLVINPLIRQLILLLFSGHNFWTRNNRKPTKGSKDLDSSLVSNENLSEILLSSSWTVGQVT